MKPEETQNIFYAKIGRIPEAHFRSCAVDYCKGMAIFLLKFGLCYFFVETPLNLRPYQRELIENSCDGHNTIICAPTGSGKTVVGAYIIRDHVYKALRNKRRYKACFIVPTTSLVQQQETLLRDYLDHCSKIKGLSGDSPTSAPLKSTIEDADIIVITPQLIVYEN